RWIGAPGSRSFVLAVVVVPERIQLFSQHQQGSRLSQRFFLVSQFSAQLFYFLFVAAGLLAYGLVQICTALKALQGRRLPLLDLVGVQPLFPTILAELRLGQGGGFDDSGELGFS